MKDKKCSIQDCSNITYAKGFCKRHYEVNRRKSESAKMRHRECNAQYRKRNIARCREYDRKYREEHIQKERDYDALYNSLHYLEKREYRKRRPEISRASHHKARCHGVSHTSGDERSLYNKSEGRCFYCGKKVKFSEGEIDHVVPLSRGGNNGIGNIVWSCVSCNRKKGKKFLIEFVHYGVSRSECVL